MLLLVAANGHQVGLIEQDVSSHQGGIGEQARVDVVRILGGLVFELGHAAQLAEHGIAIQHPAQLRVGGDVGLDEQDVLLRVQAAGNIGRHLGQGVAAQVRRHLPHRDGVHIRQHVIAVIFIGQSRPVFDRAQI